MQIVEQKFQVGGKSYRVEVVGPAQENPDEPDVLGYVASCYELGVRRTGLSVSQAIDNCVRDAYLALMN